MKNTTLCYIERDGCYLLLHRVKKKNDLNHNKWVGIGGKFEETESPEECLLRETREETGIEAALLEDYPLPVPSAREDDRRTVWFYPARYLAGDLCAQKSEVSEAGWIKISDAAKRITFAPDRAAFLKALEIMKISR